MFQNLTPAVKTLLIANVVIFGLPWLLGMLLPSSVPYDSLMTQVFGMHNLFSQAFYPWQFVSYMFLHADLRHLFFNMIGLLVFGPLLEYVWGSKRFYFFYFIAGVGAGLLYFVVNFIEFSPVRERYQTFQAAPTPQNFLSFVSEADGRVHRQLNEFENRFEEEPSNTLYISEAQQVADLLYDRILNAPMIGASGAVFAILMAFGLMFPNTELMLLFPPIPVKAKYMVAFYGLTAIYGALMPQEGDNVAHYAHLGGMIFGWLLVSLWKKDRNRFY